VFLHDIESDRQGYDRHDDGDAGEIAGESGDCGGDQQDRHQRLREPAPDLPRQAGRGQVTDPVRPEALEPLPRFDAREPAQTTLGLRKESGFGKTPKVLR
jgi:hypothetical protein